MRALVTGATGFVGRRLLAHLDRPVVLSRNPQKARDALGVEAHAWDALAGPPPPQAFDGVDLVIHLAGDPVAEGRWTAAKKRQIRDSRVVGTQNLVAALDKLERKPATLISASAIGYYGSQGDKVLDESAPPSNDFLADVCRDWEAAAQQAAAMGIRVCHPRIGIVLGRGGGALQKMLLPFKLGLGGRLGSGRQWMSWIHLDDLVGLILFAAEMPALRGAFNAVAPHPVTNLEFTKTLGRLLRRPTLLPAPRFALRLALGEFADFLLASQRVVPRVMQEHGYPFRYTHLEDALSAILHDGAAEEKNLVSAADRQRR